jgi:hypothetical protein
LFVIMTDFVKSFVVPTARLIAARGTIAAVIVGFSGCAQDQVAITAARPVPLTHDNFALADANHDGKLSRTEASDYLVYVVFTAADTNGDSQLTAEEWSLGDPAQLGAFRTRDTNRDGIVTLEEALAYGRHGKAGAALIHQADRNRDGKLNRAELDAYLLRIVGANR